MEQRPAGRPLHGQRRPRPLLPGDLLYFGPSAGGIHHTALYLGNGYLVEAPYSGAYVSVNTVSAHSDYYGALRVYPGGSGASVAGPMYHEIRNADGQSWTGLQPLPGKGTTEPAQAKRVAIAGMPDGSAQVLIVGWDNVVYHEIRNVDGSWTGFQPLSGAGTPNPAGAKDVAITGMPDGSAQVLIIGADDRVYHEIRNADGLSWTGFQPLMGSGTTDPAGGSAVSIAGMPDGAAQVVIVGQRR